MSDAQAYEKLGVFYLGRPLDPETRKPVEVPLLYDSQDLLTHAVCLGMTGSGKTGLCIGLLEEAAIDGIPALIIDPKGDLGNLLLTFPDLAPGDFEPWVDEAEAARQGKSVAELAAAQAELWKQGLADWGQSGERIHRLREAADVAIYTPGSEAGLPLSVLASLKAPGPAVLEDADLFTDRIQTVAGSLLSLLGIEADPVKSREHVLLSNLLADRFRVGADLDLATLIHLIQEPPFARVGVMDLESFYPAKDRFALAVALNNLLASPAMQSWLAGDALDVDRLLYTAEGKPRLAILSIAHLSDNERMFFVSLLLSEVVGWMRGLAGTSSLRAVLYMDEVFGFLPPVAEPPSKKPILTLLKQARAFGLGVVLASQNPADLDYKALSNAGTWFLGRLQTERDKLRVIEGLEGVAAAGSRAFDRQATEQTLAGLAKRTFLLHNVHEGEPLVFQTRWALSYLRGPMTRQEIKRLMDPRRDRAGKAAGAKAATTTPAGPGQPKAGTGETAGRPLLPPDVPQAFLAARGGGVSTYEPALLGLAAVHYLDAKRRVDHSEEVALLLPLEPGSAAPDWRQAEELGAGFDPDRDLEAEPAAGAVYGALPDAAAQGRSYRAWEKDLADALFRERPLALLASPLLGATAAPGEAERAFRIRLADLARQARDAEKEKLRQRYAGKIDALQERVRRAEERVEREKAQASQQRTSTMLSFGATALSALFGRKRFSRSTVSRASTALRGVSRSVEQGRDVDRAEQNVEALEQSLAELNAELERELAALGERYDPQSQPLETVTVRPRKSDVTVRRLALAWAPWRSAKSGGREPAWR